MDELNVEYHSCKDDHNNYQINIFKLTTEELLHYFVFDESMKYDIIRTINSDMPIIDYPTLLNKLQDARELMSVVQAFEEYASYCLVETDAKETTYNNIPDSVKKFLPNSHDRFAEINTCIVENQMFINQMLSIQNYLYDNMIDYDRVRDLLNYVTDEEISKVKSTLRQVCRDWSDIGKEERDICNGHIIKQILKHKPIEHSNIDYHIIPKDEISNSTTRSSDNDYIRSTNSTTVLVPGCGVGRLAYDLAKLGYSVSANEYNYYMGLALIFLTQHHLEKHSFRIYPNVTNSVNWMRMQDRVIGCNVPDIDISPFPFHPIQEPQHLNIDIDQSLDSSTLNNHVDLIDEQVIPDSNIFTEISNKKNEYTRSGSLNIRLGDFREVYHPHIPSPIINLATKRSRVDEKSTNNGNISDVCDNNDYENISNDNQTNIYPKKDINNSSDIKLKDNNGNIISRPEKIQKKTQMTLKHDQMILLPESLPDKNNNETKNQQVTNYDTFDVVISCFFLDTSEFPFQYLALFNNLLVSDGLWINFGPLLYHHTHKTTSIELFWEEIDHLANCMGFEDIEEGQTKCQYVGMKNSMMNTVYDCVWKTYKKNFTWMN